MTTEKLTARLSDGTEWEFTRNPEETFDKSSWVAWLRPLKPSPPKEVWVNVYKDGGIGCAYTEKQNALNAGESRDAILNRYILAPEPEPKPAREWWEVRGRYGASLYGDVEFESEVAAQNHAIQLVCAKPTGGFYKIVHVREVVSE